MNVARKFRPASGTALVAYRFPEPVGVPGDRSVTADARRAIVYRMGRQGTAQAGEATESDRGGRTRVDGRAARSERTRRAIVEAHVALIDEGDLKPTGERIAERAGVSLRTLWINFKDMEGLFAATGRWVLDRQYAQFEPVPVDLPLPDRVAAFCAQRAAMLEAVAPAARAAALREPFSEQLRHYRALQIGKVRDEVERLFSAEISSAGPAREQVLHALVANTTFSTWAMLREQFGLDVDAARDVMARTVSALLATGLFGHR